MVTYIIIALTCAISYSAFQKQDILAKYIFSPYATIRGDWYRIVSHGFLHAGWDHLIFNMLSLYFFGLYVEHVMGWLYFSIMYLSGIAVSSLIDLKKHKDDKYFHSLGASGAVSSVVFASIFYNPWGKISFIFLPVPIPAIIYGVLYLAYCQYMSRKNVDNIGHDAHFMGAIYGFFFPLLIDFHAFESFVQRLLSF